MSINHVTVSGNLTRDPEVRTTVHGKPVMSLGIAVNDRRRNPETGEWEEFPNFFNCTMFGTRGEQLGELLAKGDKVVIEGSLRYSQWETKDGERRSNIEIIIEEVEFLRIHAFE